MSDYYVFYSNEDGGHVQKFTKKELEADMQAEEDGLIPGIMSTAEMDKIQVNFLEDIPDQYKYQSMFEWGYDILIIKGTPVVPRPKSQVTVWEV
ncbi:MAG: hypothetical protein ACXAEN_22550 [Candidatus Thorarchaeota archaeon]|jgi:hypothetical protein